MLDKNGDTDSLVSIHSVDGVVLMANELVCPLGPTLLKKGNRYLISFILHFRHCIVFGCVCVLVGISRYLHAFHGPTDRIAGRSLVASFANSALMASLAAAVVVGSAAASNCSNPLESVIENDIPLFDVVAQLHLHFAHT